MWSFLIDSGVPEARAGLRQVDHPFPVCGVVPGKRYFVCFGVHLDSPLHVEDRLLLLPSVVVSVQLFPLDQVYALVPVPLVDRTCRRAGPVHVVRRLLSVHLLEIQLLRVNVLVLVGFSVLVVIGLIGELVLLYVWKLRLIVKFSLYVHDWLDQIGEWQRLLAQRIRFISFEDALPRLPFYLNDLLAFLAELLHFQTVLILLFGLLDILFGSDFQSVKLVDGSLFRGLVFGNDRLR